MKSEYIAEKEIDSEKKYILKFLIYVIKFSIPNKYPYNF